MPNIGTSGQTVVSLITHSSLLTYFVAKQHCHTALHSLASPYCSHNLYAKQHCHTCHHTCVTTTWLTQPVPSFSPITHAHTAHFTLPIETAHMARVHSQAPGACHHGHCPKHMHVAFTLRVRNTLLAPAVYGEAPGVRHHGNCLYVQLGSSVIHGNLN